MTDARPRHSRTRTVLASLLLVGVFLFFDRSAFAIDAPLARSLGLPVASHGQLLLLPYALLMVVRLALDALVVLTVCIFLGHPVFGFPLTGPDIRRLSAVGLATGLAVMTGTIAAIIVTGNATVAVAHQSPSAALFHGAGWLTFDLVGAAGEELFGRVAVLLVAQRLLGRWGAIVFSGLTFSLIHVGNPGATWIWLARLFLQGVVLAYAVYRTGSVWWPIGYHAGWNWASAPLFGAAGSGYLDEGHLLDFSPTGPDLLTGGAVGPEGSVFAFAGVIIALFLLKGVTPDQIGAEREPAVAGR